MTANPNPNEPIIVRYGKCAIGNTNPRRPKIAYLLKSQGGMARILAENSVATVGDFTNFLGQLLIRIPKSLCGSMLAHSLYKFL
jgi:hypothetical protein